MVRERPEANFLVRIFVPFVDVTVRSVVRGARISTGPFLPAYYKIFDNPYVKQIKKLDEKLKSTRALRKTLWLNKTTKTL